MNVLGGDLEPCSFDPVTGFYRDGYCRTEGRDPGFHAVCAVMTEEFLEFTKLRGNDLTTPQPQWLFPGLKPGDRWCVVAARWQEALEAGGAPPVLYSFGPARERVSKRGQVLLDVVEHAEVDQRETARRPPLHLHDRLLPCLEVELRRRARS